MYHAIGLLADAVRGLHSEVRDDLQSVNWVGLFNDPTGDGPQVDALGGVSGSQQDTLPSGHRSDDGIAVWTERTRTRELPYKLGTLQVWKDIDCALEEFHPGA